MRLAGNEYKILVASRITGRPVSQPVVQAGSEPGPDGAWPLLAVRAGQLMAMKSRVVDLNDDVLAIRRLRAAAVLPRLLAMVCGVMAVVVLSLEERGWTISLVLACSAALLILLAHAIERGVSQAIWLLTAMVVVMTALGAGTFFVPAATITERAQGVTGLVLMLAPSWILVSFGWKGIRQRRGVPPIEIVERSAWSRVARERRSGKALALFTTAAIVYVAGLVPAALAVAAVGGHLWAGGLAYAPVAAMAGRIWSRGRRLSALRLQEVRTADRRSPVLLLRSFRDDSLPLEKRYHLFWFLFAARETLTLEGFVVDRVWRLGPVIAIGNPGDRLSPLGAAREYVGEDRWRGHIREYLDESAHVVCILGDTPGVGWEYQQIEAAGKDDRVLVVFPPRPPEELQRRWQLFKRLFTRAQPLDLQWRPFIGVPLLALFAGEAAVFFYCKYRHETAYSAAFDRLFDLMGLREGSGTAPNGPTPPLHARQQAPGDPSARLDIF